METPPPTPPAAPEPTPQVPAPAPTEAKDRQWAAILHLSAFAGFIIPIGNIVGPLLVWLIKKTEMPSLEPVGKAVLNFQISWSLWGIASVIVAVIGSCIVIPIVLPFVVLIAWVIFMIIGGVKASNGEPYSHPLTIAFLK